MQPPGRHPRAVGPPRQGGGRTRLCCQAEVSADAAGRGRGLVGRQPGRGRPAFSNEGTETGCRVPGCEGTTRSPWGWGYGPPRATANSRHPAPTAHWAAPMEGGQVQTQGAPRTHLPHPRGWSPGSAGLRGGEHRQPARAPRALHTGRVGLDGRKVSSGREGCRPGRSRDPNQLCGLGQGTYFSVPRAGATLPVTAKTGSPPGCGRRGDAEPPVSSPGLFWGPHTGRSCRGGEQGGSRAGWRGLGVTLPRPCTLPPRLLSVRTAGCECTSLLRHGPGSPQTPQCHGVVTPGTQLGAPLSQALGSELPPGGVWGWGGPFLPAPSSWSLWPHPPIPASVLPRSQEDASRRVRAHPTGPTLTTPAKTLFPNEVTLTCPRG